VLLRVLLFLSSTFLQCTAKLGDKTYEGALMAPLQIEFNADTRGYIIAEGPGGVQKLTTISVRPGETSTFTLLEVYSPLPQNHLPLLSS
jgi:hypothetical protein